MWVEDYTFGISFELNNSTVTIINPNDKDTLRNTVNNLRTQYMHGGVSVTCDKISCVVIYRYVMDQGL